MEKNPDAHTHARTHAQRRIYRTNLRSRWVQKKKKESQGSNMSLHANMLSALLWTSAKCLTLDYDDDKLKTISKTKPIQCSLK